METAQKSSPPPWPARGTPEYEERLARMRAGHAARLQKAQQAKAAAPPPPVDLIDVGDPEPARMAPEPRQEGKGKPAPARGKSKDSEIDEPKVREYLGLLCNYLGSQAGHEHWQRDDDELRMVTVPGVRCYNRLDKRLREQLQAMSDPAALVFGLVVVFGPSVALELKNVGKRPQGSDRPSPGQRPPQPQQQPPPRQAEPGVERDFIPGAAPISSNGAAAPAPVADLPSIGI